MWSNRTYHLFVPRADVLVASVEVENLCDVCSSLRDFLATAQMSISWDEDLKGAGADFSNR